VIGAGSCPRWRVEPGLHRHLDRRTALIRHLDRQRLGSKRARSSEKQQVTALSHTYGRAGAVLHTEEVVGSNPTSPTNISAGEAGCSCPASRMSSVGNRQTYRQMVSVFGRQRVFSGVFGLCSRGVGGRRDPPLTALGIVGVLDTRPSQRSTPTMKRSGGAAVWHLRPHGCVRCPSPPTPVGCGRSDSPFDAARVRV